MMFKTLGDLNFALLAQVQACADAVGDNYEAMKEWHKNNEETQHLQKLWDVYFKAFDNPPKGVIGVGAITFAEQKLIEAQQ